MKVSKYKFFIFVNLMILFNSFNFLAYPQNCPGLNNPIFIKTRLTIDLIWKTALSSSILQLNRIIFDYIFSYAPYNNIKKMDYPHVLITTSLSDNRVLFDEPAKFTAKLRDLKTDNNLLLLKTEMDAGHGGKSGRDGAIEELAFDYAFILKIAGKI